QQMVAQKDPMTEQAKQLALQEKQADIGKKTAEIGKIQSASMLNVAKSRTEGMPDAPPMPKSPLDIAEQMAKINETNATAMHKRASAVSMDHRALITPLQLLADHAQRNVERAVDTAHRNADRALDHHHRTQDRQQRADQARAMAQRVMRNATP